MARTKPSNRQSQAKDTRIASASAVSLSAFHPSLPLFASASLALDAWHVRIADTTDQSIRNAYSLDKGQTCRCMTWGTRVASSKADKTKKKRKVEQGTEEGILGVGINNGSISLFVASESVAIATLHGGHNGEVLALTFTGSVLWSTGADANVVEWDTRTYTKIRTIQTESSNSMTSILASSTKLLTASHTIYQYALPEGEQEQTFTNHTSPVHSLAFGTDSQFVSAAQDDRYMNIFSIDQASQARSLIAEADVRRITCHEDLVCAVTVEGTVELFQAPFAGPSTTTSKKRKSMVMNAASKIRVKRPNDETVDIQDVSLRTDNTLILMWNEGARLVFESVVVFGESGELTDTLELTREKRPLLGATNGLKDRVRAGYHDSNAQIGAGPDVADLEMEDGSEGKRRDRSLSEDEEGEEGDEEDEEPTLAERLHSMEVTSTPSAKPQASKEVLKMPAAGSLSTVLTQALRSSDTALLESCLHHNNSKVILATVRRLDATLAVTLLEQLASRLARRPGRSGDLGVWVRWTIVVHGGYLASLPGLVRTLSSLHNVLSTRAASLPRLLALQGRLDMVHAQIELRREGGLQENQKRTSGTVEYNEGESDLSDEEEIGIEDASEFGGLDSSDDDDEEDSEGDEAGDDFSDDSQARGEFDELDAQMEMMQSDDDEDIEEVDVASDDEA